MENSNPSSKNIQSLSEKAMNMKYYRIIITAVITALMILIFGMQCVFLLREKISGVEQYESSLLTKTMDLLDQNEENEKQMIESLKEEYIVRARAASYIIEHNPELEYDVEELQKIAGLIKVDELFLFDTAGTIYSGSVPKYFGYCFDSGEQMSFFKPMLDDYDLSLCQDMTPNTAEAKQMMYALVWREDRQGMIQIGVEPTRLLAEMDQNDIYTILDEFAVVQGINILIADSDTRMIVESTDHDHVGLNLDTIGYTESIQNQYGTDFFKEKMFGNASYNMFAQNGSFIIGVTEERNQIVNDLRTELFFSAIYLFLSGLILVFVICHTLEVVTQLREERIKEQQVQNERLSEALEKAETANRAKSTFLFNMSHDIRTPMNAIMGFTRLLKDHRDNAELFDEYIGKIESSNELLLSIINNVLDMARIESGKETLNIEPFDMTEIRKDIIPLFTEQMAEKGITFITKSEFRHRYIYADGTKLKTIFLNLLSNAYKYTPAGGTVTMTSKEYPGDKPGYVVIETVIEDNGIGMSKEFQEKLFESFTRERTSTQSRTVGTGLGMAIVKNLVDMMGGTIEVESELGKGTRFTVRNVQRLVEDQNLYPKEINTKAYKACSFKGRRILLAEDNDLNAEIAITILEDAGFIVEHAEDGVMCFTKLKQAPVGYYDVILMDIQMPNMDGYTTAQNIRKLPEKEKADIPIIAMTANAFEEDKKNAFDAGMNGHITKPIKVEEVFEQLKKVLL